MADVRTSELVINKLTKQQYENIQNPSPTELYLVPEDEEHKPICYPTTASGVSATSMVVKSSVSDNGKILTENGFVYNTSGNPTISDTKVVCDLGVGFMEKVLENLTRNTEYHIKSYGQNSSGLVYGSELIQRTPQSPIPIEYQLVEYLESNGTQYIDTGRSFMNGMTISIKLKHTSYTNNYNTYIGSFTLSSGNHNILRVRNNSPIALNPCIGTTSTTIIESRPTINLWYEFELSNYNNKGTYRNGYTFNQIAISGNYNNLNVYIFNLNFDNATQSGHAFVGDISYLKVYEQELNSDTILENPRLELYPVYRIADNKPGMYDIVNGVFYTNQGTGEFTVGPDKEWDE